MTIIFLLLLSIAKSNQYESIRSCQSYWLNNKTILEPSRYCNSSILSLGCCGNCTHRRCCQSFKDLFDEIECTNNNDETFVVYNETFFKQFKSELNDFFEDFSYSILVFVLIYLSILLSLLPILWLCSIRIKQLNNLSLYQHIANRYYFLYKLFGIEKNYLLTEMNMEKSVEENSRLDEEDSSSRSSDNSSVSTASTGGIRKKIKKLVNMQNTNIKILESKQEKKANLIKSLLDDGILIKFDDIDEKFHCKKFNWNKIKVN